MSAMGCPECEKQSRQEWSCGYPQTHDTPAEPAGWECGWCGHVYAEDTGAYVDYKYEESRAYENEY